MRKLLTGLTILQKNLLTSCLFILAIVPLMILFISSYFQHLHFLHMGLSGVRHMVILQNLLDYIPLHRVFSHRALLGDRTGQEDLQHLQILMDQSFNDLLKFPHPHKVGKTVNIPKTLNFDPIVQKWQELKKYPQSELTPEISDQLHDQLINELLGAFDQLANALLLLIENDQDPIHLIEISLVDLPHLQELIYQSSFYIGESLSEDTLTAASRYDLYAASKFIEYDLKEIHNQLNQVNSPLNDRIKTTHMAYSEAIQNLLKVIHTSLLSSNTTISREELFALGKQAIFLGSRFWEQTNNEIEDRLIYLEAQLTRKFWLFLLLSTFLALSAFFLALHFNSEISNRLKKLAVPAINNFAQGQTSSRIIISQNDEIGKLGGAFNEMADRLEKIIDHFHKLIRGLQTLGAGDLSVRLSLNHEDQEFIQTVQAFNHMVSTFEIIISRLQHLSLTLTSSANRLSAAAQEQEKNIAEQEMTTSQIVVAAHEISSTGKEFAHTVNNLNKAVEYTSLLASTGKDSLSNMESIMKKMIQASSKIGTKLAILNEKADNITNIISTITKVADQTNLLSLNASIEAEKAGEFGKSFAVIAREIRYLSDQTANATGDIEKTIYEIITAISSSVMGVDDFTQEIGQGANQVRTVIEQLTTIIEHVQDFTARFETINEGIQSQSTGAEQINQAIIQLSYISRQSAESIHQFYATVQELTALANELRQLSPHLKTSSSKHS